jgi:hypothetical protein
VIHERQSPDTDGLGPPGQVAHPGSDTARAARPVESGNVKVEFHTLLSTWMLTESTVALTLHDRDEVDGHLVEA